MACSGAARTATRRRQIRSRCSTDLARMRLGLPHNARLHLASRFIRAMRDVGAQERTRTFTAVKPLAPEASASTNSTTWALGRLIRIGRTLVKYLQRLANTLYSEVALAYRDSAKYVR